MTSTGKSSNPSLTGTQRIAVISLFFASGFAGLVCEILLQITPPEEDPYLVAGGPSTPLRVNAGYQLHGERIYRYLGIPRAATQARNEFNQLLRKAHSLSGQVRKE